MSNNRENDSETKNEAREGVEMSEELLKKVSGGNDTKKPDQDKKGNGILTPEI